MGSESESEIRLNRYLAQCGLGSRRKADEMIASGNVFINGQRVTALGARVRPGVDKVEYHGKEVKPLRKLEYFAFHKPRGLMVTKNDPEGRPTIYDALRRKGLDADHLNYAGRLDFNSEGLLLLTNDGDLIHALTHPRFGIKKVYLVKVNRRLTDEEIVRMKEGIESEGQVLHAADVRQVEPETDGSQCWYQIDLFEGKNRQVRRMFEGIGLLVSRLRRVQFGTLRLHDLPSGELRPLTQQEVAGLKNLGYKEKK
ncbi:MAG: rRNA pseudouridine synthase [Fibrobacter sp.]|jgi:23S rRNA pseudouridine2605 synthase|nr:rRNA pseudouridine synthase [Fibrobacter sp.]HON11707.1 pseudouridine synthase [Chitinispirillaceae bacterium]